MKSRRLIPVVLLLLLLGGGVWYFLRVRGEAGRPIQQGSAVRIHYTLTVDGQVVDSSLEGEPLAFVQGEGNIIPGLEEQLAGLKKGDKKEVDVAPEKGYGHRLAEAVQKVPRDAFSGDLKVGDLVNGESGGQRIQATVVEAGPDEVTLDMNHPLAGKSLHFSVEVLKVD